MRGFGTRAALALMLVALVFLLAFPVIMPAQDCRGAPEIVAIMVVPGTALIITDAESQGSLIATLGKILDEGKHVKTAYARLLEATCYRIPIRI